MGVALWAATLAAVAGCDAAPRPGFLAQTQQACLSGDREACELIEALSASPATTAPAPDQRRRTTRSRPRARTDVDAVLRGMERARTSPRPPPAAAPDDEPP